MSAVIPRLEPVLTMCVQDSDVLRIRIDVILRALGAVGRHIAEDAVISCVLRYNETSCRRVFFIVHSVVHFTTGAVKTVDIIQA